MSTPVATRVGRFVWHEQLSADPKQAQDFYTKLFGWEIDVWKPGELDYAMISTGGTSHGGFYQAPEGVPPHWMGHVQVENVDATVEQAKAAGGSVMHGPMDIPEVGRFAVVSDPQGGALSAYQPEGEAPQSEGVFVWDELMTSDVAGAKSFYGEIFGWTTEDMDMGGGMTYTLFKAGETQTAGAMPLGQAPSTAWLAYIGTDDVDASASKAQELGATIIHPPTDIPNVGRFSVVQDPTGAVFGLFQGGA